MESLEKFKTILTNSINDEVEHGRGSGTLAEEHRTFLGYLNDIEKEIEEEAFDAKCDAEEKDAKS